MARNPNKRRCRATTAKGRRCRSWAMRRGPEEDGQPLCNVHAGRTGRPDAAARAAGRACTAKKGDGSQCRNWAVRGSEPPLCRNHANQVRIRLPEEDERRCTAVTKSGEPCRRWALREGDGERQLCNVHAGRHRTRLPGAMERANGRQCAAQTEAGTRCGMWAMEDSEERYGRPLCAVHAGVRERAGRMPDAGERRCTARTVTGRSKGERCRRWAMTEDAALCWLHAYPNEHGMIRHGYFRARPPLGEVEWEAIRLGRASGRPLDGEIVMARLLMEMVMDYLRTSERPLREDLNSVRLIMRDARAVAKLLLARKELEGSEKALARMEREFERLERLGPRLAGEGQGAGFSGDGEPAGAAGRDETSGTEEVAGPEEAAGTEAVALLEATRREALAPEIALVRDLLPQVLATVNEAAAQGGQDLVRAGRLVVRGTRTVADLMQAKEALRPEPEEMWAAVMDEVLDELGEELGIEL